MRGKGSAGCARLLPPDFWALLAVNPVSLRIENRHFGQGECFRQEEVAFFMELADLVFGQHVLSPVLQASLVAVLRQSGVPRWPRLHPRLCGGPPIGVIPKFGSPPSQDASGWSDADRRQRPAR